MHALAVGFGLGFLVAIQPGPMSLFLMRSTLRRGWAIGLAIGAGIATIDGVYATLGAAGAVPLLTIGPLRVVLGLVGAAVLVALGVRTLVGAFRIRNGAEVDADVAGLRRAFATALAGTASNPATIASWAAIFSAASAGGAGTSASAAVLLVAGVTAGSAACVAAVATGTAIVRRAVGVRAIRVADTIAGVGLIGFGGALAYGAVHDR